MIRVEEGDGTVVDKKQNIAFFVKDHYSSI